MTYSLKAGTCGWAPRRASCGLGALYTGVEHTEQRSAAGYTFRAVKAEYVPAVRALLATMAVVTKGSSEKYGVPIDFAIAQAPLRGNVATAEQWLASAHQAGNGIFIEDVETDAALVGAVAPDQIGPLSSLVNGNPEAAILLDPPGGWGKPISPAPAADGPAQLLPSAGSVPLKYVVIGAASLLALGVTVALVSR